MKTRTAFALGGVAGFGLAFAMNSRVEVHRAPMAHGFGVPVEIDDEFHEELMETLGLDPDDLR